MAEQGAVASLEAPSSGAVRRPLAWRWPLGILLPLLILAFWQYAASRQWIASDLLPPPVEIFQTGLGMIQDGSLAGDIWATSRRLFFGFLLGAGSGTVAGLLTGATPLARRLLDPTLQALRSVPSLAWVPLFILWFGIYDTSKVLLIAVGVFFPVYLNLMAGIAGVDRKLIEVGRVHNFGLLKQMLRIQLPAALPSYLTGLRSGLGLGWMFIASAEMMGADNGLGFILINGEQIGRPDQIIVAILAFAALGKTTDWLLARAAAKLTAWQDTLHADGGK